MGCAGLLERESELHAIDAALAAALAGRGTLTLVEGPAGIGKTGLIDEAWRRAEARELDVRVGRCGESERDFAFSLVLQLFEERVVRADPDERQALFAGAALQAAGLFAGVTPPPGSEARGGLFPLLHGLYWLTANLAERRPLLLAVDDAHWSDAASLSFLAYLAQRLEDLPVAMLVAQRPGEPASDYDRLAALGARPGVCTLRPAALSRGAVGALVEQADLGEPEGRLHNAIAEATGGNPFLVRELLAAVRDDSLDAGGPDVEQVRSLAPDSIARVVLVRLARLPPAAAALAGALSVLEHGPLRLVAELAGLGAEEAAAGADALAAARIVVPGASLSFAHPVERAAVQGDLRPAERADMHLCAARLLDGEGAPVEAVASHLLAGAARGDDWTVARLRAAARRARANGVPAEAAKYLRRAFDEPPGGEVRAEVLIELGNAEAAAGLPAAAARLAEAREALADPERRADVSLALGEALYARGRYRDAAEAFDRGAREPGIGGQLRDRLEAAYLGVARLEPSLAGSVSGRLQPLLTRARPGSSPTERSLIAELAMERVLAGAPREEAVALARRAWADGALLRDRGSDGSAVYVLTAALVWADELELALAVLDRAIDDARLRGSPMAFATASYARGAPLLMRCRVRAAIADLELALEAERDGWEMFLPQARGLLSTAWLEAGDPEQAGRPLEDMDDDRWRGSLAYAGLLEARARLLLAQGRADAARADALELGETLHGIGAPAASTHPWRSLASEALVRLERREEARALAEEELELARAANLPRTLGVALRARGLVERGIGALGFLTEAVEVLERSPAKLELARALADLGAALRRSGRRGPAREPLRRALDLASRGGAEAIARRADAELRAAGARPRRQALRGVGALTPSELRVARLAAGGLTNREIAEALFVSRKTVDWHLRHIYQKLEVTRSGLAGALAEVETEAA